MTTLLDIARTLGIVPPRREDKLVDMFDALQDVEARMDLEWNEADHPRASDGKFSSGGGGSAVYGAKSYYKSIGTGKPSASGIVKYMLKAGTYSKPDIVAAAKEIGFSLGKDPGGFVSWYHNDMKKKGEQPPPIPKVSGPKEAGTPTGGDPDGSPAAPKAAELPPTLAHQVVNKLPLTMAKDLMPFLKHLDSLTPENKLKVETKLQELIAASGDPKLLAAVKPIAGNGMSITAVNAAIAKLQLQAMGTSGPATTGSGYTPSTDAEKAIYHKLKAVAHYHVNNQTIAEDHEGKDIGARLKASTKAIPGDYFAKVSSAYGADKSTGNTHPVGQAMASYGAEVWKTFSDSERDALSSYKGTGYSGINKQLLGIDPEYANESTETTINHIDAAMAKSVVPADTPVFRGLSATLKDLTGFDDPEHAVGRAFEHKNYASCSRSISISKGFGKTMILRFTIPAGANGIVLGEQIGGEREIVLPRSAVFKVDKVEGNMIDVTYLGVREDV